MLTFKEKIYCYKDTAATNSRVTGQYHNFFKRLQFFSNKFSQLAHLDREETGPYYRLDIDIEGGLDYTSQILVCIAEGEKETWLMMIQLQLQINQSI